MTNDRVARVALRQSELVSSDWLSILARISEAVRQQQREAIEIDLSSVRWIGQLPLLGLCLGLQHAEQADFAKRFVTMPESSKVRAFLYRWGFYRLLDEYRFIVDRPADTTTYSGTSTIATRVLGIHNFSTTKDALDLRDHLRQADTDLRKVLQSSSQLTGREIHGLADLVIYELCKNAAEHAMLKGDAFIFGRFSPGNDDARFVYDTRPAYWETATIRTLGERGLTEIVLGDGGTGIVETLQEEAAARGRTAPSEILTWAFQPLSTRKRQSREHTRGLWAVKNKVRELRGVLYVRTGDGAGGGISAVWDFFTDPTMDRPRIQQDRTPFAGTQFHILLPQRSETEPITTIELRRRLAGASDLSPRGFAIPPSPKPELGLQQTIERLDDNEVLFVDLSPMQDWEKHDVETIAREIFMGIEREYGRVWLLDPSPQSVADLQSSRWLRELWERQATLVPIVTRREDRPPRVEYVISDPAIPERRNEDGSPIAPHDPGDTLTSRRALLYIIGMALGGEAFDAHSIDLNEDERSWLDTALASNRALVASNGHVVAALDVESLAATATEALLDRSIHQLLDVKFESQTGENSAWYLLPSRRLCRYYFGPHVLDGLSPAMAGALERRVERMIRQTRAQYAVAYTSFSDRELRRAANAGVPVLVRLDHYQEEKVLEKLSEIPENTRAVLVVLITGSGGTIARLADVLMQRGIETHVVCAIDTISDKDRDASPILQQLWANRRIKSVVRREVPTEAQKPETGPDSNLPLIVIDPETLLPLPPVDTRADRLSDGAFWDLVGRSQALFAEPIAYKGIDYTTLFWARNLANREAQFTTEVVRDLRTCFKNVVPGVGDILPDIICLPEDTYEAVTEAFRLRLEKEFPNAAVVRESELTTNRRTARDSDRGNPPGGPSALEGKYVAIFAIAASSGGAIGRLLAYFETARRVHIALFINRIPEGITAAFTRQNKVRVSTFKRIYSASPELRLGSARSIAIRSLDDYRPSCLSNRLLLFVEEQRRTHTENIKAAQSPDELQQIAQPIPPPAALALKPEGYDFSTSATINNLKELIRSCQPADLHWLYAILEEAASRLEAGLRRIGSRKDAWRRQYVDYMEDLYRAAPAANTDVKRQIINALLLDRWEWHGRRRESDVVTEAPRLGEVLLSDLRQPPNDPSFSSLCIRSLSKVHRPTLIQHVLEIADIARRNRDTELTLALELTKILDDDKSADGLLARFGEIVRKRAAPFPAEEALDVALDSLLADIGLERTSTSVEFMSWNSVRAILDDEPPDHSRTVRALIRAMRGSFGKNARFLYYREMAPRQYAYGDGFPRRAPAEAEALPGANLHALELLKHSADFHSAHLGKDERPHVKQFLADVGPDLAPYGMALYVMQFRESRGIFRVWQNVRKHGPFPDAAIKEMQRAVVDAKRLLERGSSSLAKTGTWQYQRIIERLQDKRGDTAAYDPLRDFTERVRRLLGGDIASVVVLNPEKKQWTRRWLLPPERPAKAISFPANAPDRLTIRVAREKRPMKFSSRNSAREDGVTDDVPAKWSEAWLAFPLLHGEDCRAVVHVWHHTPGWFDAFDDDLLGPLQRLGGGLAEVAMAYDEARTADRWKVARPALDAVLANLVELTGITSLLAQNAPSLDETSAQMLVRCTRGLQENLITIPQLLDLEYGELLPTNAVSLVAQIVAEAAFRHGPDRFQMEAGGDTTEIPLDIPIVRRAVSELLKNAAAHTAGSVRIGVFGSATEMAISVATREPESALGVMLGLRESMGTGFALARAAADRHGGRVEEARDDAGSGFRLVVPRRASPAP